MNNNEKDDNRKDPGVDKKTLILMALVCLIPIVIGAFLYKDLPDQMPIHWNAAGEVDGYASKVAATFIFPLVFLALTLLMPVLLKIDPKYRNMSPVLISIAIWLMPALSLVVSGLTLGTAMGYDLAVEVIIPMFLGVVFIAIGNFLPKTKQSYTLGIRVPWTLNSEENWNRTHRLGGFVFVIGGILTIIVSALGFPLAYLIILAAMVLIPIVYSYLLYRKGI